MPRNTSITIPIIYDSHFDIDVQTHQDPIFYEREIGYDNTSSIQSVQTIPEKPSHDPNLFTLLSKPLKMQLLFQTLYNSKVGYENTSSIQIVQTIL